MDIKELRKEKAAMEDKLFKAVSAIMAEFEGKTGLRPKSVDVQIREDRVMHKDKATYVLTGVTTDVCVF